MEISKEDLVNSLNTIAIYLNDVLESGLFDSLKDIEPKEIDQQYNVNSDEVKALDESIEKLKETFIEKYNGLINDYNFLLEQLGQENIDPLFYQQIQFTLMGLPDSSKEKSEQSQ